VSCTRRIAIISTARVPFFALLIVLVASITSTAVARADTPNLTLSHVRGNVYVVVEDHPLSDENSAVYIGRKYVTVIGATLSPESAKRLAAEIAKVTRKPIQEVIDTNYNLDRAGGNPYFRSIGARIVSIDLTRDLLQEHWTQQVARAREQYPAYPDIPLVLPDTTYPGNFELQGGGVKALYLGPSHTPDDVFVYFPQEKILYGGCALKEQLGNLASADLNAYPKTLQKLRALHLGYTTIIAGHWSPIHGPELVNQYLQLLAENTAQQK
jgi:metallo-beta-lactamase class B